MKPDLKHIKQGIEKQRKTIKKKPKSKIFQMGQNKQNGKEQIPKYVYLLVRVGVVYSEVLWINFDSTFTPNWIHQFQKIQTPILLN